MILMKRSARSAARPPTQASLLARAGKMQALLLSPVDRIRGGWEGSIAMNAQVMDPIRFGSCSLMFQTSDFDDPPGSVA